MTPNTVLAFVIAALLAWIVFLIAAFSGYIWVPLAAVVMVCSMYLAAVGILGLRPPDV